MSFELRIDESLGVALRRCLVEQAERLAADVEGDERGEAIHKARKRCKRLRAVFRCCVQRIPTCTATVTHCFAISGGTVRLSRCRRDASGLSNGWWLRAGDGDVLSQLEGILHKDDPTLTPELLAERSPSLPGRRERQPRATRRSISAGMNFPLR